MTKEMIISSSAHETRVAILEEDQVAEIFIERERSRGVVGNLYKGRVSKVLPGMQSAFIDLGLERDGFLYVSDVIAPSEEFDRFETEEEPPASAPGENGGASARQASAQGRRGGPSGPPGRGGAIATATMKKVPSPKLKSSSRKARRSSSRSPRSRSAPRARG